MNAPITYAKLFDGFATKAVADWFGESIREEVEWVRRDGAPRLEAFYARYPTSYFYGTVDYGRSYDANTNIPPFLKSVWAMLDILGGVQYEACFLNRYDHGNEHLGWHADRAKDGVIEGIDHTRPIAVMSFGAERELWFRSNGRCPDCEGVGWHDAHDPNDPSANYDCNRCEGSGKLPQEVEKLLLESGSLCLMLPGMQHTHQHRIPKAGKVVGTRISLTFRGLLPHTRAV